MTSFGSPLQLDWDDLRLFLEVARTGTLTAAADRLKISQPTAGRRLRSLEIAVGSALFQRTSKGLRLTDEGEAMLLHAEHMEEDAIALERKLMGGARGLEGALRVSTSDWFAPRVLARPLADFAIRHPGIAIELLVDSRLLDLNRREADLVLRFVPFAGADIVQRKLCRIRYGVYAAADYLARHGDPVTSEEGDGHRLITFNGSLDASAEVVWFRKRWPKAFIAYRSNSRESQAEACVRGVGLAILPDVIARELPITRLDDVEPPDRDVWLGYHGDLKRLRRLRALVDHLVGSVPPDL